jgi:hypothetical protein
MSADKLLSCLDAVVSTGTGTWRARCPSHDSKGRTLAIKHAQDGTVLLNCFAGCSALEVVQSVGMTLGDLFPEPLDDKPRRKNYFPAADVLKCLTEEATIVQIAAGDLLQGKKLNETDWQRLNVAAGRIKAGREVAR